MSQNPKSLKIKMMGRSRQATLAVVMNQLIHQVRDACVSTCKRKKSVNDSPHLLCST